MTFATNGPDSNRVECHKKRVWGGRNNGHLPPVLSSSVSRVQAKMKAKKREKETNFLRDVARIAIALAAAPSE